MNDTASGVYIVNSCALLG